MTQSGDERELLFGALALRHALIDALQFAESCVRWQSQPETSLSQVFAESGWLSDEDAGRVWNLVREYVQNHQGDVRQALAELAAEFSHDRLDSQWPPAGDSLEQQLAETTGWSEVDHSSAPGPPQSIPHGAPDPERILRKSLHSSGGIGQVWIAWDQVLEREVALKELKTQQAHSDQSRRRFFREARLTGQLEHPGIVPVYEFSALPDGSRSYYTMRFVRGRTLTEAIRAYHAQRRAGQPSSVSPELLRLLNVFVSICHTIAYAHSRGVIHRDLKGDNIILGDFGEAIVLDWGLAKRLGEPPIGSTAELDATAGSASQSTSESVEEYAPSSTLQGERLGTPAYMAPEQALGQIDQIDEQTDLYGLAAILYEILTGEPPFQGTSVVAILDKVIHATPVPPSVRMPGVPRDLEAICLRGLSKDKSSRQASVSGLAAEIESWIADRAERKRTEQERERFFSLSQDLLSLLDTQGRLTQTNPAWEKILGWSGEELRHKTVWDLLPEDEHARLQTDLDRILAGESLAAAEHRCFCKDGGYRWVHWNASLVPGESAIYLVGRDVTERKQSEQTFQELLESAPDGMVVVNAAGTIVLVNRQLERVFGYLRDELLGKAIEMLVPDEVRGVHPAHVSRFVSNPDFRPMASGLALRGRRKDGTVFPAEISLSPVRTEQGLLVSCAVRDLSQRMNAETSK